MIRTPIIAFLGHVDAGKTTLQDFIRKTSTAESEPGEITQSIGASRVPGSTIKSLCGSLLEQLRIDLKIPGFLMIDTPGHSAFVSLRRRGGTLADLAVLVVDVNDGLMPQTLEAIEILKKFKTPFVIAVNKLDTIEGWMRADGNLLQKISAQQKQVQDHLDTKIYDLVMKMSELGFNADRYDRVEDYSKTLTMVPCSAKTGEGIPELLVMIAGISQKFLGEKLEFSESSPAKGTIIEVTKEKGMGTTLDTIIYEGVLRKNDQILIGGIDHPILTKVKALLEPKPLSELKEGTRKLVQVQECVAATGVKISAIGIESALAGMPMLACSENFEQAKKEIQKEISEMEIPLEKEGIIAKADTLGSLEALVMLLRENSIKVKKASVGAVTRKDISDASAMLESDPLNAAIAGFNVETPKSETRGIKIITGDIIYSIIEKIQKWQKQEKDRIEGKALENITRPCKILLMKGYVFRQSNPAIIGTEVILGKLKAETPLMKKGPEITRVKEIKLDQKNINEATKGQKISAAYEGATLGRQIKEEDTLYSAVTENDYKKLKELKQYLSEDEKQALREIGSIMREENPMWGV